MFENSLDQIERVLSFACRRLCLAGDDAEDFAAWARLELIQDDYRILREFSGRSSLATYLTAVIQNLARDFRMKRWGRWRPSAAARKLGLVAMQLETLLRRDGFTFDEAAESLRSNHGVRMSRTEIADLAARLPHRVRLRFDGETDLDAVSASSRSDRQAMDNERRRKLLRVRRVLVDALAELPVEDRLILRMHYESGLTLSVVARALEVPQREIYTRRDRSLRRLKELFLAEGLEAEDVIGALGPQDEDLEADVGETEAEVDETGPSNSVNSQDEGGS